MVRRVHAPKPSLVRNQIIAKRCDHLICDHLITGAAPQTRVYERDKLTIACGFSHGLQDFLHALAMSQKNGELPFPICPSVCPMLSTRTFVHQREE